MAADLFIIKPKNSHLEIKRNFFSVRVGNNWQTPAEIRADLEWNALSLPMKTKRGTTCPAR
jgi:hypothetical protein